MSGVFASVSTTPMYATVESPTEDDEESPNTTEENVPGTDDDDQLDNTSPEPPDGEESCPEGQVTNPQTDECASTLPEPCPEGQVTNPQIGECTSPPSPININNNTVPNSTVPIIKGNCIAVATSEGVNASSAAAASVTCINQQINNVIKQQRVGQVTTNPIVQSDNMKLGQTQIDTNNLLVIADFYPFRIVGGHVSANLHVGNDLQVIIGEIDTTGILSKAVALPLIEARNLTINDILYSTQLGSVVQGRDIFSNNDVNITSPNIIMLYNSGDAITFSGPNSIAYTAIIN
ncbi:MAG: hypothetical protein WBL67_12955 [Nitrososphaeraceae archaeon]